MNCVDRDRLLELSEALDWTPERALEHLRTCSACRTELTEIQRLHDVLSARQELTPSFTDRVMDCLPTPRTPSPGVSPSQGYGIGPAAISGVAAAISALVAVLLVGAGAETTAPPGSLLVLALAVGAGAFVADARRVRAMGVAAVDAV